MSVVGEYTLQIMQQAGWYNNWLFSFVKPHLIGDILEVGAGIGNFTGLLHDGSRLYAIDAERRYLKKLQNKYLQKVTVGFGDIEKGKYFFKDRSFDTIVCLNVLEHIKEDKKALKNMHTLLRKKGKLILLVPAHVFLFSEFDKELGHFRRYDKKNLNIILKKTGFKKISMRYLNWWAAIGWLVFLKVTKWVKMPKSEVGLFNLLGKLFLWPERFVNLPFGLSVFVVAQK